MFCEGVWGYLYCKRVRRKKIKSFGRIVTYIAREPRAMSSRIAISYDSEDVFPVCAVKLEMEKIK